MFWTWLKALAAWLAAGVFLAGAAGCGINQSLTERQQDQDLEQKMAWADKAIALAESHGIAYRIEINASGRPSLGETVDLYLDSGIEARILFMGNAAAGREPGGPGAEPAPVSDTFSRVLGRDLTKAEIRGCTPPILKPAPVDEGKEPTTKPAPSTSPPTLVEAPAASANRPISLPDS